MKRLLYILIAGVLVTLGGCKKFLEEKSLDEIKPVTTQDLTALMAGEAYPYNTNLCPVINMVTDDISCNGGQKEATYEAVVRKGKPIFSWSKNMFEELLLPDGFSSVTYLNSWEQIYRRIAGCNVALNYVNKVTGSEADKANIRGEALALRAYYYFLLVNLYAKPYNAAGSDPESNPGVPLKLKMEVTDELFKRNSVAEVYRQIESDLTESANILKQYPREKTVYKMNETAVYALLSRVYLYQEKWDQVIEYANKALVRKPGLAQLSTFSATNYYKYNVNNNTTNLNKIYDPAKSVEIIWAYQPVSGGEDEVLKVSLAPTYNASRNPPYQIAPELLGLYESRGQADTLVYLADLRPRLYLKYSSVLVTFIPPNTGIFSYKPYSGGMGGAGIRVAELYMNRAEANIRKFIATGNGEFRISALSDINAVRISRYDSRKAYVPIDIADGTALLNFCKDERRREFPFDGHRWFDLRRYGMPSITHVYEEIAGAGETFTLSAGDSRYTLPIPKAVMDRNGLLTQNP